MVYEAVLISSKKLPPQDLTQSEVEVYLKYPEAQSMHSSLANPVHELHETWHLSQKRVAVFLMNPGGH